MQAEAGFMTLTGEPDGPPVRFGLSMVDFMTGSVFALGIVSAILAARASGKGCDVDVSLFDVALHQTSYPAVWAMNEGHQVGRPPRGAHPSISPSQRVRTQDGWGMLMCQTQRFWEVWCDLVGRSELKADPRFGDMPARRANLDALTPILDAVMVQRTGADWLACLGGRVPFAPIADLAQALDSPFVAEVAMRDRIDHPARPQGLDMLACPIRIDGQRMPAARAPALGEHNDPLLGRAP